MDFDYKSRKALADKHKEKWEKKNKLALTLLSKNNRQLIEDIFAGRGETLDSIVEENTEVERLSEWMKKNYKKIVELFGSKGIQK